MGSFLRKVKQAKIQEYKKIFSILSCKGTANQSQAEILYHTSQKGG